MISSSWSDLRNPCTLGSSTSPRGRGGLTLAFRDRHDHLNELALNEKARAAPNLSKERAQAIVLASWPEWDKIVISLLDVQDKAATASALVRSFTNAPASSPTTPHTNLAPAGQRFMDSIKQFPESLSNNSPTQPGPEPLAPRSVFREGGRCNFPRQTKTGAHFRPSEKKEPTRRVRTIFDLRYLNTFLHVPKFKLVSLQTASLPSHQGLLFQTRPPIVLQPRDKESSKASS